MSYKVLGLFLYFIFVGLTVHMVITNIVGILHRNMPCVDTLQRR